MCSLLHLDGNYEGYTTGFMRTILPDQHIQWNPLLTSCILALSSHLNHKISQFTRLSATYTRKYFGWQYRKINIKILWQQLICGNM